MKKINLKKIFFSFFLLFIFSTLIKADNKIIIEVQIGNEIITNIDVENEKRYLIALNNNLKNIPKKQLHILSKNSIIREKIKKIELLKFYDFNKADKYTDDVLKDFFTRIGFNSLEEFNAYLITFNLDIKDIAEKLKIETLWNELIFNKFKDQVYINKEELKKKVNNQKNKNTFVEYNLSEILFLLNSSEKLEDKYNLILKNIEESGFKNSANIFSISESSKFGGEIGWINESQLNELFLKEISSIDINGLTKPIQTSGGYLILKLNEKRKKEEKIDLEKALNYMIIKEKNRQLSQFSLIYFNKIKQNLFVSEK